MNWRLYAKDHIVHAMCILFLLLFLEGILYLYHVPYSLYVFVLVLFLFAVVVIAVYDYSRRNPFFCDLQETLNQLEEKYMAAEMVKRPNFLEGKIYYDSLREMTKSMNDEIIRHEETKEEWKRYLGAWVHEIKIPLSVIRLMAYQRQTDERKFKAQLKRIETDIEQVLYYIRSETPEKDYRIQKCPLKDLVDAAIKENRDSLILGNFTVKNETGSVWVYTDGKWLSFMLGQMINNAVNYAKESDRCLLFYTEISGDRLKLIIEDHGIGVAKGDLARIFEKSFTGENGHQARFSTGMGLYLCRKMCAELGHTIEAESEEGKGTRIKIGMKHK